MKFFFYIIIIIVIAVILSYIGAGKKDTGDWCFTDGFITFQDIMECYLQHFRGKTCTLYCDCSYSGQWVRACEEYLNNRDVRPCGHSARKNEIQVKIYASCQPDQIGSSLIYFARGCENDKNTGAQIVRNGREISPGQITCGIDFTRIICGKSWDEECALSPETGRIYLNWGNDRLASGRRAWNLSMIQRL